MARKKESDIDKSIPSPEKLREILHVVRKEVPGMIREIADLLYSEKAAKDMGKAVGIYYKTLIEAGIPKEAALEMTKGYVLDMGRMFDKGHWNINSRQGRDD